MARVDMPTEIPTSVWGMYGQTVKKLITGLPVEAFCQNSGTPGLASQRHHFPVATDPGYFNNHDHRHPCTCRQAVVYMRQGV